MGKTITDEIQLSNGHLIKVQTSTRQEFEGEKSTFISLNTDYFRIRVVQRISLDDLLPHRARIGISTEYETADLEIIETLALSLKEALKLAAKLNQNVNLADHD